jgi:hypothetical protein
MKLSRSERFLVLYSGGLTCVLAFSFASGFVNRTHTASFDQINVKRINVVEPDGTVRLVISDRARFPGLILKNIERQHYDRKVAGILFFDDEGTEKGGLTFGGKKDGTGAQSYGHLSFDDYMQDQAFALDVANVGDKHQSKLTIWDQPTYPITEDLEEKRQIEGLPPEQRDAVWNHYFQTHKKPQQRFVLARGIDDSMRLELKDTSGRNRLTIRVNSDVSAK